MKKPSKKIISLAIIAFSFVLGIGIYKYADRIPFIGKLKRAPAVLSYTATGANASPEESVDTDGDGLKDWQEVLWGTDYEKTDSDTDGTPDGQEVEEGRNPRVPGPNDSLDTGSNASKNTPEDDKPLNSTDILSRELFSRFMELKNSDNLTEENEKDLVGGLASQAASGFSYKTYNYEKLKVFSSSQKEAVKFYASAFAVLQMNFLLKLADNQKLIASNPAVLAKLYSDQAQALYDLSVPQTISEQHLSVVNNMSIAGSAFESIGKYKEDPLKATVALQFYSSIGPTQNQALKSIANFLRQNDIIFTSSDIGSYWNKF